MQDEMTLLRNILLCSFCLTVYSYTIPLPPFSEMKKHYPGFHNSGGLYHRHDIMRLLQIQDNPDLLLHDTSALRLSYTLNRIGHQHSLGSAAIRLSKYGTDSIKGRYGLQYMFHPLAFGPYLADKYGYPNVSKLHLFDAVKTKESFQNKQGLMRVITYAQRDNEPKGHVALWDCNGFYKAPDFFSGHTLLSVEFWETPDTDCSHLESVSSQRNPQSSIPTADTPKKLAANTFTENDLKATKLDNSHEENLQAAKTETHLMALLQPRRRHPVHRRKHNHT